SPRACAGARNCSRQPEPPATQPSTIVTDSPSRSVEPNPHASKPAIKDTRRLGSATRFVDYLRRGLEEPLRWLATTSGVGPASIQNSVDYGALTTDAELVVVLGV